MSRFIFEMPDELRAEVNRLRHQRESESLSGTVQQLLWEAIRSADAAPSSIPLRPGGAQIGLGEDFTEPGHVKATQRMGKMQVGDGRFAEAEDAALEETGGRISVGPVPRAAGSLLKKGRGK